MFRLRLGTLALAAGFGLACGCISLSDHPLFKKHCSSDLCVDGVCDGPVLGDVSGGTVMPGNPGCVPAPLAPQDTPPQLAPAPRLVPQPTARPEPFYPNR